MNDINQVVEKMKQLFITVRYKYIKLNEDGSYHTFNIYNNDKHVSLNDGFLKSHILQKSTYGIFAGKYIQNLSPLMWMFHLYRRQKSSIGSL